MSNRYQKQYYRFTGQPKEVLVPVDCDFINIRNAGGFGVKVTTDRMRDGAYDVVDPGAQDGVYVPSKGTGPRFKTRDFLCYLAPLDPDNEVKVCITFIY